MFLLCLVKSCSCGPFGSVGNSSNCDSYGSGDAPWSCSSYGSGGGSENCGSGGSLSCDSPGSCGSSSLLRECSSFVWPSSYYSRA